MQRHNTKLRIFFTFHLPLFIFLYLNRLPPVYFRYNFNFFSHRFSPFILFFLSRPLRRAGAPSCRPSTPYLCPIQLYSASHTQHCRERACSFRFFSFKFHLHPRQDGAPALQKLIYLFPQTNPLCFSSVYYFNIFFLSLHSVIFTKISYFKKMATLHKNKSFLN